MREMLRKAIRYLTGDNEVAKIARRYLVMNSFDGALTILGVVVGTYFAEGPARASVVLSAGFGTSLAMGISGFVGAYLTETSERMRSTPNSNGGSDSSMHEESLILAFIDGVSPALITFVAVLPFIVALRRIISVETAFISSTFIIMVELFGLGVFLGRIAGKNMILHGLITVLAGVGTFVIVSMLPF